MALEAKKRLNLTEVWLLINPKNPLKSADDIAEFEHRAALCELLCKNHPWLKVSYFEAETTSAHTADTLQKLKKRYRNEQFIWLMGSDNMPSFHKWKNWQQIIETTPIVIFSREDNNHNYLNRLGLKSPAFSKYQKSRQHSKANLNKTPQWRLLFVPLHQARATDIRKALHQNKTPSYLTPAQLSSVHLTQGYKSNVCRTCG